MKDYLNLSPTPIDEPCAMVGSADYNRRARLECRVFINQLERTFPQAIAAGVTFLTASNPHDFGPYLEVRAIFDDENEDQLDWAYIVEGSLPEHWDDDARAELAAYGYETIPA